MKSKIMPTVVLTVICLVVTLLLSFINVFTAPVIEAERVRKQQEALKEVMPGEEILLDFSDKLEYYGLGDTDITNIFYRESDGAFVFQVETWGYSSDTAIIIMCGIDGDGNITATKCIQHNETPSYGRDRVITVVDGEQKYAGMSSADFSPFIGSGATITSNAYSGAIEACLSARDAILTKGVPPTDE